jgi:hypothetical protein
VAPCRVSFCILACQTTFLGLNGPLTVPTWEVVDHWNPSRGEGLTETRDASSASVRMRSGDDWPLAKILFRFPGVSQGR